MSAEQKKRATWTHADVLTIGRLMPKGVREVRTHFAARFEADDVDAKLKSLGLIELSDTDLAEIEKFAAFVSGHDYPGLARKVALEALREKKGKDA